MKGGGGTDNLTDAELLLAIKESGIVDFTTIAEQLKMAKKQKYLNMHRCKIWLASDGYYKTKLPKGDDTNETRLVKKKNRSDIEKEIIKYYEFHSQEYTFKYRFDVWVERQKVCGRSNNTIYKYMTDYKRFFMGYPFEKLDIRDIDDEILSAHIIRVLEDKPIKYRALGDIFGYIKGVFDKAIKDKIIEENPCKYIDLPIYQSRCEERIVRTASERILSPSELESLMQNVRHPKASNSNMICCFAIEMAIYTGMRVGEISALMWKDIMWDDKVILIRHSEKRDSLTKEVYVSLCKNGKERFFPLTEQIADLLQRITEYEQDHGWFGEYVFQDAEGRVSKSKISDATRNRTMSSDFVNTKSVHSIRRTLNSNLKYNGVPTATASSLLGHTPKVNEANYTYDTSEMADNKRVIEGISAKIVTKVT